MADDEDQTNVGMSPVPRGPMLDDHEALGLAVALGRSFLALKDVEAENSRLSSELTHVIHLLNQQREKYEQLHRAHDEALSTIEALQNDLDKAPDLKADPA